MGRLEEAVVREEGLEGPDVSLLRQRNIGTAVFLGPPQTKHLVVDYYRQLNVIDN